MVKMQVCSITYLINLLVISSHKYRENIQGKIANFVHKQIKQHSWEDDQFEYTHKISKGFTNLKEIAYTTNANDPLDYRISPPDKSNMSKYLFTGFSQCLYTE
jgi:type III restriction enzyme